MFNIFFIDLPFSMIASIFHKIVLRNITHFELNPCPFFFLNWSEIGTLLDEIPLIYGQCTHASENHISVHFLIFIQLFHPVEIIYRLSFQALFPVFFSLFNSEYLYVLDMLIFFTRTPKIRRSDIEYIRAMCFHRSNK